MWWDTFLEAWNGVSMIPASYDEQSVHHLYTDATGAGFGCGATWNGLWWQYPWPPSWRGKAIAIQELLPIVMACMIWGPWWANGVVMAHCDNEAVVCVVNSGYSKDKDLMHLVWCLFFVWPYWGIQLQAVHNPGEQNTMADAISRGNLPLFFQVSPPSQSTAPPNPPASARAVGERTTGLDVAQLDRTVQELFTAGLAGSTQRVYRTGERRYGEFCGAVGATPLPAKEETLMAFVASLYWQGLSAGTVKSYLAAVRHAQIAVGLGDPRVASMPKLEYVTKGLRKRLLAGRNRRGSQ